MRSFASILKIYNLMKNLFLVGGGGHARSCIDVIEKIKNLKISGIIDKNYKNKKLYTYPNVKFKKIIKKNKSISYMLICIGQIKDPNLRKKLFYEGLKKGYKFIQVISPYSYVSPRAQIGEGTIVMHGAIVNAGAVIGKNCIINSNSLIEHDVKIGNHCHISTGAIINGGVKISDDCFIGSGSVTRDNIKIGKSVIIQGHTFVNTSVKDKTILKR